MARRTEEDSFDFPCGWGGRREGAGRKPGERVGVPHRARSLFAGRFPVHATVRLRPELPSLRRKPELRVLGAAFRGGCERPGFRLVHYAVLGNHIHLLIEAADRSALSRGMTGLLTRIARRLNGHWRRRGAVFEGSFHEHVLRTPREVRNTLAYLFGNARRHGYRLPSEWAPDPYTSGFWFDGWRDLRVTGTGSPPVARARTWLLRVGWRRQGLLHLED